MLRGRRFATMVATSAMLALAVTACGDDDEGGDDTGNTGNPTAIVTVNGTEPQNKLLPANTNETGGGRIMDMLYKGLIDYDADGQPRNQVAESIETEDSQTFTIKIKDNWTFTNGEKVTAKSFVDAWNFGALVTNAQLNSYFFEPIKGYAAVHPPDPTPENLEDALPKPDRKTMTGLKVVDDTTFTVELSTPQSSFPLRLGYTAFHPLPQAAFENPNRFGEKPIGNGPYMIEGKWRHKVGINLRPNPNYQGVEGPPKNGGIDMKFYANPSSAYQDLLADNLDVIDLLPTEAFATYEDDLGERAINQPAGIFQSFTFPLYNKKFQGPKGVSVRKAVSMAIDREAITEAIFNGTRTPAKDFTSPVVQGYSETICGDLCTFNPEEAKRLLDEAGGYPGGKMTLAYNADGGHKEWVDAVCNQIRNTLEIDCEGKAYPLFDALRTDVTNKKMDNPFRTGWQMDWPAIDNFLGPLYAKGAGSNDGLYDNPQFDALLKQGDEAASPEEGIQFYQQAEQLLVEDVAAVPLWYSNANGGYSTKVQNVKFDIFSKPIYSEITKS